MKRSAVNTSLSDRLAALSEPIRLRIARLVERQELSVGEVAKVVQLPQSTVSRHLKVLSAAELVQKRAEGTATMYRLSVDDLSPDARALWMPIREQMASDRSLAEDDRRLEGVLAERRTDSLSFFGRVGGEWDKVRAELFGETFTAPALLALLPRDWVVADVGCGTGNAAELLAAHVREVIAIDQSATMLDAAKRRVGTRKNVRFIQGPLEALPLPDAGVDAAVCVLVLHHVNDPVDAMGELARVVRPGGTVLIADMFEHDRAIYRQTMGHLHLGFSASQVRRLMEDAGLERVNVSALQSEPDARGPGLFVATGLKPTTND